MQLLSETTISPFEPSQFVTPQFLKDVWSSFCEQIEVPPLNSAAQKDET